jgi:hypothetical protein
MYDPGYQMPTQRVHPEVLIYAWFKDTGAEPYSFGSGFFIGPWNASLLTAAHVVYRGAKLPAIQLRITVKLADGTTTDLYAAAAAVFHPNRYDVAVVRLKWRRPGLHRPMPLASHPTDKPFQAKLAYFKKDIGPEQEKTTAEWMDPRLVYSADLETHGGMSGGALMYKNYVVGVHHGERDFNGKTRGYASTILTESIMRMEKDARDLVAGG